MIVENHKIAHRNVVSKYYNFIPAEIDAAFRDFNAILEKSELHADGTMFFSIISDPTEEVMTAEIFLTVEEGDFKNNTDEQMYFRSYFSVDPMIMTRITDDFDEQSQVKYWELINYIRQHGMEQRTPVFAEFKRSQSGRTYVEMSVGV